MSPTTKFADIEVVLTPPKYARPEFKGFVAKIDHVLQMLVLELATGGKAPDVPDVEQQMLDEGVLKTENNESVLADNYDKHIGDVEYFKGELDKKERGVNESSYSAFKISNGTYTDVTAEIDKLNRIYAAAAGPPQGEQYMPLSEEIRLWGPTQSTVQNVNNMVYGAVDGIQNTADEIERNIPDYSALTAANNNASNGGGFSASPVQSEFSAWKGEYDPKDGEGTISRILGFADGEIGIKEIRDNVVPRPYNNNSEWCAAFADWVWRKAGIKVNWSDYDLVRAVWSDAGKGVDGLTRSTDMTAAKPGDMVIFKGQNHVGVVVENSGGQLTVVEGNSGKAVKRNTYNLAGGGFEGVVHPPADQVEPAASNVAA